LRCREGDRKQKTGVRKGSVLFWSLSSLGEVQNWVSVVVSHCCSNDKETNCQQELVTRAEKARMCTAARPVLKVILRARAARPAMNTASFAGIRLNDEPERWN